MQRISILLCFLVVCFATAMQAQAPAPKPNPEVKKLQAYVGHWTVEGEWKPGPWGPGVKIASTYDGKMTLGGFFFQGLARDKGVMQVAEYFGYDPVNKNFVANTYMVDGTKIMWVGTASGNTFSWTGKAIAATGEQYSIRGRDAFTADFKSLASMLERSADGKTWVPFLEMKWTKAAAPAKK
jgi:hypothetical protein